MKSTQAFHLHKPVYKWIRSSKVCALSLFISLHVFCEHLQWCTTVHHWINTVLWYESFEYYSAISYRTSAWCARLSYLLGYHITLPLRPPALGDMLWLYILAVRYRAWAHVATNAHFLPLKYEQRTYQMATELIEVLLCVGCVFEKLVQSCEASHACTDAKLWSSMRECRHEAGLTRAARLR